MTQQFVELLRAVELTQFGKSANGPVADEYLRQSPAASAPHHLDRQLFILTDVLFLIGDTTRFEKIFGLLAVAAAGLGVDFNSLHSDLLQFGENVEISMVLGDKTTYDL
jgi:hypothetical protein